MDEWMDGGGKRKARRERERETSERETKKKAWGGCGDTKADRSGLAPPQEPWTGWAMTIYLVPASPDDHDTEDEEDEKSKGSWGHEVEIEP